MNLSCRNRYGIYLLLMILGTTLLFVNSKYILNIPGLLILSVILISLPVILIVFSEKNNKNMKLICLILVFLPLILFNYICYIQNGLPVGFADVHDHISQYEHLFNNGTILFSKAQAISYNSVGLYVLHKFIEVISDTDIVWLASVIPPFINILITLTVFLFINRLFSLRIAVIATMMFGWSDTVLLFGQEFRPQTIGTLFLFEVLLVISIFYLNKETKSSRKTIIMLLFFGGLALISFVSWVFALIIIISILIVSLIFGRKKDILITPFLIIIFCLFIISYIIFIGISLKSTVESTVDLLVTFFTNDLSSPQFTQVMYGSFITWFMYCFWGIFIIGSIYYLKEILFKKLDILKTAFFISFSTLFLFGFIISSISTILNTARVYIVVMLLIGTIVTISIFKFLSVIKSQRIKIFIKLLSTFFIILIISTSLSKFPSGIVGNTQPLRGHTNIDDYDYWYVDSLDYTPASFSKLFIINQTLYLHMSIERYMFKSLYDQNKLPIAKVLTKNATFLEKFAIDDIVILENSEHGKKFVGRDYYPSLSYYSRYFNQFYSNGDYQIFCYGN